MVVQKTVFWFSLEKHKGQMENGKTGLLKQETLTSKNAVDRVNRQPMNARHLGAR